MIARRVLAAAATLMASPIFAIDGEWNDIAYSLKSTVIVGAAIRAEDRDLNTVGKLSVPGQKDLCATDGCSSLSGDPAPNQRLVDAKGAYSGTGADDGNWNYDKGDITDSIVRYSPDLQLKKDGLKLELSGLFYYDPVNADFTEYFSDDKYRPSYSKRPDNVVDAYARGAELRKAFMQVDSELLGNNFTFRLGRQLLPWGEALTVIFNNLNQLNPLDAKAAARPGFQISDASQPINMAVLSMPLSEKLSLELVKPLEWRPVALSPHGSFANLNDPIGNYYATLGLGNQHDDPNKQYQPGSPANRFTASTYFSTVLPEKTGYASDQGQFGARLTYVADWLDQSTEFGLYYLKYHSQLPYLSGYATEATCIRNTTTNIAQATLDCRGFKANTPLGLEPLPLDTTKIFLDYPEDINLLGLSFNTNVSGVAFSGEYAYRPNMPLQVHTTDLIYTLFQPGLPANDISIPGVGVVPSANAAAPSYLAKYRGVAIQPKQLVRGYERFGVHNLSLSGLNIFRRNPFGADDLLGILEVGATYVPDMPDVQELALNGSGDNTHPSPGADGTGTPDGTPDSRRGTPTSQTWGLPSRLSYGYRGVLKMTYNSLIPGAVLEPSFIFFHDLKGITPAPATNFVAGRKQLISSLVMRLENEIQLGASYEAKFGSNARENPEHDRDRIVLFGAYNF